MSRRLPVLLMTRPEPESRAFAKTLEGAFDLVISPLFEVRIADSLPALPKNSGVIFTSANGVRAWQALGGGLRHPCYAVGEATGRAARDAGFDPICANGSAADLIATIIRSAPTLSLVHARGQHARGDVANALGLAGIETHEAVVYDQTAVAISSQARQVLKGDRPVIVPLFSPRTAAMFWQQGVIRAPVAIVAMSDAVAREIDASPPNLVEVLPQPSAEFMRRAVQRLLDADRWVEGEEDAQ